MLEGETDPRSGTNPVTGLPSLSARERESLVPIIIDLRAKRHQLERADRTKAGASGDREMPPSGEEWGKNHPGMATAEG